MGTLVIASRLDVLIKITKELAKKSGLLITALYQKLKEDIYDAFNKIKLRRSDAEDALNTAERAVDSDEVARKSHRA